ncbi:mariner transposase [Trichonephila clavipes]|nr:mariner transposase [Trichonephila clavipes]
MSICEALTKQNEINPFLKRMVTGDEKWVTYYNIVRKQSWSKTLNSDLYCQQLDRLKPELANRRGVVFHQDSPEPLGA